MHYGEMRLLIKLHKAGLRNNLLSVFSSFLNDRHSRNLVNSYISDWFFNERGAPKGSILKVQSCKLKKH